MKTIRYAFWAVIAFFLIVIGLANRDLVTVSAMPDAFSDFLGIDLSTELPLFIVIFLGIASGLLIGFIWEWIREYRQRAEGRLKAREVETLRREISKLKAMSKDNGDDVLAILDT